MASGEIPIASVILAVLGLLFSVGDLVGDARLSHIERVWRQASFRLLVTWFVWAWMSAVWLFLLLVHSLILGICGVAILWAWKHDIQLASQNIFIHRLIQLGALVVWAAVGIFASLVARGFIRATIDTPLPVEICLARKLLLPIARVSYLSDVGKEDGFYVWLAISIVLPIAGLLLPVVVLLALPMRIILAAAGAIIWALLFGPSLMLHRIAGFTGATSYFNVGKYLVLAASVIWLIWEWIGA